MIRQLATGGVMGGDSLVQAKLKDTQEHHLIRRFPVSFLAESNLLHCEDKLVSVIGDQQYIISL